MGRVAGIATIIAAVAAVLTLGWAVFTYLLPPGGGSPGGSNAPSPSSVATGGNVEAKDGSVAAGGNIEGSTITTHGAPAVAPEPGAQSDGATERTSDPAQ